MAIGLKEMVELALGIRITLKTVYDSATSLRVILLLGNLEEVI